MREAAAPTVLVDWTSAAFMAAMGRQADTPRNPTLAAPRAAPARESPQCCELRPNQSAPINFTPASTDCTFGTNVTKWHVGNSGFHLEPRTTGTSLDAPRDSNELISCTSQVARRKFNFRVLLWCLLVLAGYVAVDRKPFSFLFAMSR